MTKDTAQVCSCRYCDSQHTQMEFALHKLSNGHLKNVQKALFQHNFRSVCLVCNLALKDLNQMELHVRDKKHTEQMSVLNYLLSSDKYTCRSCGIAFFNEVALEAHRMLALHTSEASSPGTPTLNKLSEQLSGLCRTRQLTNGQNFCSVCNVIGNGIEEAVMHCFTSLHITRLRASFCILCKKEFMHFTDREAHLSSAKHLSTIRKCSQFLQEVDSCKSYRKGGYACMICMIWFNSWFCLELHILEAYHEKAVIEHKRNNPLSWTIVFVNGVEGTGAAATCDESMMSNWKLWREQALEEHIWCHRCGLTFFAIDEAHQHLASGCQPTNALHAVNISGSAHFLNVHECGICAMSFKSNLMLSAHTASPEHHKRQGTLSKRSNIAYCCSSCGLLLENEKCGVNVSGCKDLTDSFLPTKDSEAVLKSPESPSTGFYAGDGSKSLGGTRVSTAKENLVQGSLAHFQHTDANGLCTSDDISENLSKQKCVGTGVVANCSPNIKQTAQRACTYGDRPLSDKSGSFSSSKNAGNMPANVLCEHTAKHGNESCRKTEKCKDDVHSNICVHARVANPGNLPHCSALKHITSDDSLLPQNEGLVSCQRPFDSSTLLVRDACLGDVGVPVIVAATLAPLEGLRESLKSVTAIVAETLLSSVRNLCTPQADSSLKRKSHSGEDEADKGTHLKRLYTKGDLEAALQQGLNSIKSENGGHKSQHGAEDILEGNIIDEVKVKQDLGAVIAMAASAIPSGLPDLCRPSGEQYQPRATRAQESPGVQIPNNCLKQAQEPAEAKSENVYEVANQAVKEQSKSSMMVEEIGTQVRQHFQCQPGDTFTHPSMYVQQASAHLAKDGAKDRTKDEGAHEGIQTAASLNVASHSSKSESNEECHDDNSEGNKLLLLDSASVHGKWWSDSDEDSDSM